MDMKRKIAASLLAALILLLSAACSPKEEIYMVGYVTAIEETGTNSADLTIQADEDNPEYAATNVVVTVDKESKVMDKKGNVILLASISIGTPLKVIFSQPVISASPDYGFAQSIQIVELDREYSAPPSESGADQGTDSDAESAVSSAA